MRFRDEIGRFRVHQTVPPFASESGGEWNRRGKWPASWISVESPAPQYVAAYALTDIPQSAAAVRVHVSADERYELYLNGHLVGRGSERGNVHNWFFETYELSFDQPKNTLVAKVWSLADHAPFAQFSLRHGFLLCPDSGDAALATGKAPWQCKVLGGYEFTGPSAAWGTGDRVVVHGEAFDWKFELATGEGWHAAKKVEDARWGQGLNDAPEHHLLRPATLNPQVSRAFPGAIVRHASHPDRSVTHELPFLASQDLDGVKAEWQELLAKGGSLLVPPHTRQRILLDFDNYLCAYPHLVTSGGKAAKVRMHWQESLFEGAKSTTKGNRDEVEDKFFTTIWSWTDGVGDTYLCDGGAHRHFSSLWWHCGRYVELLVETGDEALTVESLWFEETRYPFTNEAAIQSSDPGFADIVRLGHRTLQMCSHETYMDCPYYEQLQYIGDTRLQVLVSYVTSSDDRLPRKALEVFDFSRFVSGVTQSRYPSRVYQFIPPFSLWWVCMLHDFALWRGDKAFVRKLMPGARAVLFWFEKYRNKDGLVESPEGWNYVDWVPGWHGGMPIGADHGVSSIINRQFELALRAAAELESWLGEPELAARCLREANEVAAAVDRLFWNAERGGYADDLGQTSFSEHAQALSILTNALSPNRFEACSKALVEQKDLHQATVYFSHYVFEAYRLMNRTDLLLGRLDLWRGLVKNGLRTVIEHPEPTRSDCHAWGAHPIYHFVATLAGIRPAGLGSDEVVVEPKLGGLASLEVTIPFRGRSVTNR